MSGSAEVKSNVSVPKSGGLMGLICKYFAIIHDDTSAMQEQVKGLNNNLLSIPIYRDFVGRYSAMPETHELLSELFIALHEDLNKILRVQNEYIEKQTSSQDNNMLDCEKEISFSRNMYATAKNIMQSYCRFCSFLDSYRSPEPIYTTEDSLLTLPKEEIVRIMAYRSAIGDLVTTNVEINHKREPAYGLILSCRENVRKDLMEITDFIKNNGLDEYTYPPRSSLSREMTMKMYIDLPIAKLDIFQELVLEKLTNLTSLFISILSAKSFTVSKVYQHMEHAKEINNLKQASARESQLLPTELVGELNGTHSGVKHSEVKTSKSNSSTEIYTFVKPQQNKAPIQNNNSGGGSWFSKLGSLLTNIDNNFANQPNQLGNQAPNLLDLPNEVMEDSTITQQQNLSDLGSTSSTISKSEVSQLSLEQKQALAVQQKKQLEQLYNGKTDSGGSSPPLVLQNV